MFLFAFLSANLGVNHHVLIISLFDQQIMQIYFSLAVLGSGDQLTSGLHNNWLPV